MYEQAASTDGSTLSITVRDHGRGVPEASVGGLFPRYGGNGTAGSVGLGLWIVREPARAHGGDLTYAPADPGASFVITLPPRATARRTADRDMRDRAWNLVAPARSAAVKRSGCRRRGCRRR